MIRIESRGNESLEKTLRRFKKQCEKEGLVKDIKKNSFYEKPSERKRRKLRSAKKKILKEEIKQEKKKGFHRKKEWTVPLAAAPVRLATSPDGRHVAVGLQSAEMQIVELETQSLTATADVGSTPRDIVWCDPSIEGPMLPDWSDDDAPTLDLGGR